MYLCTLCDLLQGWVSYLAITLFVKCLQYDLTLDKQTHKYRNAYLKADLFIVLPDWCY